MCRSATTCVQPATTSIRQATPNSLHIRQAHCYIARLGNISNPRQGGVLQLVRARCVSIKCVPIGLAEQGYNTLFRVLNGPNVPFPQSRRLPFYSETLAISLLERVKVAESRGMRDLDSRESMPNLQAQHAKITPTQLGANNKGRESARTFGSIIFRYRTWIPLVVK